MKKSLRYVLLVFLALATLYACTKQRLLDDPPGNQFPPVFNSYEEAGQAVRQYLQQAGQGEQFTRVENILFMESGNKTYALVYYESNLGHSNILYEQQYQGDQLLLGKIYKCTGTPCDCKVVTHIGQLGEVDYSCSCSTCTLNVTEF